MAERGLVIKIQPTSTRYVRKCQPTQDRQNSAVLPMVLSVAMVEVPRNCSVPAGQHPLGGLQMRQQQRLFRLFADTQAVFQQINRYARPVGLNRD